MKEITLKKLVEFGDAISHPLRLKILKKLCEGEKNVYDLAKELQISRQLLYLHLKKLEKADLVESDLRLEGNKAKKFYRVKDFRYTVDRTLIENLVI